MSTNKNLPLSRWKGKSNPSVVQRGYNHLPGAPSRPTPEQQGSENDASSNVSSSSVKKRKESSENVPVEEEGQAVVDRIIDERGNPDDGAKQTSRMKHEYLCTWMDGAPEQWVDASVLEGSEALEDWKWREEAQPETFDTESDVEEKCKQLADLIHASKRTVFLLGAGLSAPVLPTYRGTDGLWTKDAHKNRLASASVSTVKPTLAHRALVALERSGHVYWIATQNFDDLSARSGFPTEKLSELHGNIFTEKCAKCGLLHRRNYEVTLEGAQDHETGRFCDDCGGVLKDSIIHFDEQLPWHELKMANAKFLGSDVAIVLGSSLRVQPAASLPFKGKRRSRLPGEKKAVLVNLQPTNFDKEADVVIRATCDTVMNAVATILIGSEWDSTDSEEQTQNAE